ncbi:MAG: FRG domain-containing protein [bacterium]|nr:MAG: FRG domain-containing protein [bacterium]
MGQQNVIKFDGKEFLLLRYDNFAALRVEVHPPKPCVAVPFYRNIRNVVKETLEVEKRYEAFLLAQDLVKAGIEKPSETESISYKDKLNFPFLFFRGDKDERHGIMPTRYRFSGESDLLLTTRARIQFEMECAAKMKPYLERHSSSQITTEQARAASRHYGAPSSFVDFSFNPEVAAFFAHPNLSEQDRNRTNVGMVYSLNFNHFQYLFGLRMWAVSPDYGRDVHALNTLSVWRIPYFSYDTLEEATLTVSIPQTLVNCPVSIRTRIIPAIPRITSQEGIFLEANFENPEDWQAQVFLWTVLDFIADKWSFLRDDFSYQNPNGGIIADKLFPHDDSELPELTKDFHKWI